MMYIKKHFKRVCVAFVLILQTVGHLISFVKQKHVT